MGSSEKVDSGKGSAGRSSFSQTCSLLSQYLKVKGSFGDLSLGLTPNLAEPKGTMNLLPMIEKSGQIAGAGNLNVQLNKLPQLAVAGEEALNNSDLSGTKTESETAQMTIFYGGQVIVFNDFPADKAKEIMTLASKCSAAPNPHPAAFAPPLAAQSPAESTTSTPNNAPACGIQERARRPPQPPLGSDLPIMRQKSLARFLEKRKDRITANALYQTSKPAAPPKTAETWLGLAPQFPVQMQRH
ncbi:protein TIFY 10B [Sesamum alatum]|uniref:Protein TIFY n=1 Tax=Sesamum alatum TaxID=300844 RepID=A0AAE2CSR1_9LAMI|nr:protein TIFY 10B [Sesamum alatum]